MGAVEKTAGAIVALAVVLFIAILGLLGWGFIEIVQWVTSK